MAGSRRWFIYTDDLGVDFAINLDESNTEAVNGNVNGYPASGGTKEGVPKNVKPRYLVYSNAARTRNIKCVALTAQIYNAILASALTTPQTIPDPITAGQTLGLTAGYGEKRRFPTPVDTGLNDGDNEPTVVTP